MPTEQDVCPLTSRQLRCVQLAADGHTADQSAGRMFVSATTVKTHLSNARGRLDVPSTTALVARCLRAGWIR